MKTKEQVSLASEDGMWNRAAEKSTVENKFEKINWTQVVNRLS